MSEQVPGYNQANNEQHQEPQEEVYKLAGLAALQGSETAKPVSGGWNEWVENNPISESEARAIQQSVDKNITLTKMYGSKYFNTDPDNK